MTQPDTNASGDENPDLKGLKEGEFRLRIGGEGTGVQINKKIDTDTARRVMNIILGQDFRQ